MDEETKVGAVRIMALSWHRESLTPGLLTHKPEVKGASELRACVSGG